MMLISFLLDMLMHCYHHRFLLIQILNVVFSEVILTLGSSRTVLEFLCAAKEKKRSFRVFVAEGAPRFVQIA